MIYLGLVGSVCRIEAGCRLCGSCLRLYGGMNLGLGPCKASLELYLGLLAGDMISKCPLTGKIEVAVGLRAPGN